MSSSGVTIETKIPLPDKTADSLTSVMTISDKEDQGKQITTVDHMIYLDKVNPADRPGTTPDQLAGELVSQGADLVIFNSDDMKDASTACISGAAM